MSETRKKKISIKLEDEPNLDDEMKDNINSINFLPTSPKKKDSAIYLLQQPIMKRFSGHLVRKYIFSLKRFYYGSYFNIMHLKYFIIF